MLSNDTCGLSIPVHGWTKENFVNSPSYSQRVALPKNSAPTSDYLNMQGFSKVTENLLNSIWGIIFLLAINCGRAEVSAELKFIHFLCSAILRHYYSTVKYPFHNTLKVTAF